MATIALYASKVNQMPGLIRDVKKSVINYKSELAKLKKKTLTVDKSVCNMDDIINSIQSSTKTQEQKEEFLDKVRESSEQFISDVVTIDGNVADVVQKRKDDFYEKYYYLKPECEKSRWEKIKDGCKKVGEWCKEHWKAVITVVAIIAAVAVIVFFPEFSVLLLFAAKGLLSGAVIGGLLGGLESIANGGSFWNGVENGAFSGALWGAAFGLAGGAGFLSLGKLAGCKNLVGLMGGCQKAMQLITTTARVSGEIALGMFGFDVLSLGIKVFDPDNPFVVLNQTLHKSALYNGAQFAVSFLAAFSGGAALRLKNGYQICFVAGTMVLTANGLVAIEDIKAGDKVIATNPDTFHTEEKTVVETYINKTSKLLQLIIQNEVIMTTMSHPFYVKNRGFVAARKLCLGDEIMNAAGGSCTVEGVEVVEKQETVYNFQVEDYHTYFVGDSNLLVHNICNDPNRELINNPPKEILSDVELKELSEGALDKCHNAGLSDLEIENIRKINNGQKPNVSTYLEKSFQEQHLAKFEDNGCYKILSDKRGEPSGTIGAGQDDLFVISGKDAERIIAKANGDPRVIEQELAMPKGYLGDNPYLVRADKPQGLRMASGNETNAWQDEWCPAGTTRGGQDEAIINPLQKGEYSFRHCFGDDAWKN